jgi:hypothetical protein
MQQKERGDAMNRPCTTYHKACARLARETKREVLEELREWLVAYIRLQNNTEVLERGPGHWVIYAPSLFDALFPEITRRIAALESET